MCVCVCTYHACTLFAKVGIAFLARPGCRLSDSPSPSLARSCRMQTPVSVLDSRMFRVEGLGVECRM